MSQIGFDCAKCRTDDWQAFDNGKFGCHKCGEVVDFYEKVPQYSGTASAQKHYQVADVQPIEIMQMYLTPAEFQGFLRANIVKYTLRLGHKDDSVKETDKIYQYAAWLRKAVRDEKIDPRKEADDANERRWQELG